MKRLVALCLLAASCGGYSPGYGPVYEDRDAAAEWITETVRAANPMSDEEPEDNIKQAERTAANLFQINRVGMWRMSGNHRMEFTPLERCTPAHRVLVEAWMGGQEH